ncbi:hypothetical protein ACWCQL_08025 [Streptomyces sp. NPDC002073]
MPTPSTNPVPAYCPPSRARHAAPVDRDRLGTFLTSSWAVLNLVGIGLLGALIDHAQTDPAAASPAATAPGAALVVPGPSPVPPNRSAS